MLPGGGGGGGGGAMALAASSMRISLEKSQGLPIRALRPLGKMMVLRDIACSLTAPLRRGLWRP